MTAFDIDALIAAADLADRTDRLMLADACEEAGRDLDALLLDSDIAAASRLRPAGPGGPRRGRGPGPGVQPRQPARPVDRRDPRAD